MSIIMDGNGRWAELRGEPRSMGHIAGIKSVKQAIEASIVNNVEYLSLYAFSEENWSRPQEEVDKLMSLMLSSIGKEREELNNQGIRFRVLGNRSRLSLELNNAIDDLMQFTEDNTKLHLIIMLSYSGKWDILQAAKALAQDYKLNKISEEEFNQISLSSFEDYLVTRDVPDPDIILRTASEQRLSNYFLWQASYSELIFIDTLWPDFTKEDYDKALKIFSKRERRFGKV